MTLARITLFACALLAAAGAQAHAMLEHADPRVGAAVDAPPPEVKLWFSEPLEGAFSSAKVTDAAGRRVDRGSVQLDTGDKALLHVPLQPLAPGAYTVQWRAVSIDTHVSQGKFGFRVGR